MSKGKLYGLDLFSGIGGNTLGLGDYIRTVAYCEQDRHAQAVLLSRMGDGSIPAAPIWDDITTLSSKNIDVPIDIIVGGFPCQDISIAGKGAGLSGERSGLFYEIVRLAKEIQPTFLFLENVPAIRTRGLDTVIQELTKAGYDCRWTMLSAAAVGAPHKRERWFLLAHAKDSGSERELRQLQSTHACERKPEEQQNTSRKPNNAGQQSEAMAHSNQRNDQSNTRGLGEAPPTPKQQERGDGPVSGGAEYSRRWWTAEPDLDRVVNGLPLRVDRIKRLGNAVVPEQARQAFKILMGIE